MMHFSTAEEEGFEHYMFSIPCRYFVSLRHKISGKVFEPLHASHFVRCGRGGVRTLDRVSPMPVFETGAFNHSATLPKYTTV